MIKQIQKMKNKKGFTLIEIIVVLVILSILVAVALPTMFGYVEEARAKSYAQEARVGFLAAQWILVEQVLIGDLTPSQYAIAVEELLNRAFSPSPPPPDFSPSPPLTPIIDEERLLASFESKLQGVTFPWRSPTAGSITGFSDVVIDAGKAQVTGITYTTTNFTITIGEGKTVTSKNSSPAANPGGVTPCAHATSTNCEVCDLCGQTGIGSHSQSGTDCTDCENCDQPSGGSHTPGTSIGDCETCGVCGVKPSGGIHSPGTDADCENTQDCTVCSKVITAALGHSPSGTDCTDCENCDQPSGINHTPGATANCTTAQVCTVCNKVLAAALGHSPKTANCTQCNNCSATLTKSCGDTCDAHKTLPGGGGIVITDMSGNPIDGLSVTAMTCNHNASAVTIGGVTGHQFQIAVSATKTGTAVPINGWKITFSVPLGTGVASTNTGVYTVNYTVGVDTKVVVTSNQNIGTSARTPTFNIVTPNNISPFNVTSCNRNDAMCSGGNCGRKP